MQTFREIWDAAANLRDGLVAAGDIQAALRINETLSVFWTSHAEALGELHRALRATQSSWGADADSALAMQGDRLVARARRFARIVESWEAATSPRERPM